MESPRLLEGFWKEKNQPCESDHLSGCDHPPPPCEGSCYVKRVTQRYETIN